ncbi:MAG: flagellar motor switch protein FliG, partial [Candidatus Kapabacteria bacterium]|nr:flagellar motor switch protein FliG [Candidatus Kapabacteria bacterium]
MPAIVHQRQLTYEQLSGKQKVALLLMALDVETAALILRALNQHEIEQVGAEIAALEAVPKELTARVIEEVYQLFLSRQYVLAGGVEYARLLLERTFGPEKSRDLIEKV